MNARSDALHLSQSAPIQQPGQELAWTGHEGQDLPDLVFGEYHRYISLLLRTHGIDGLPLKRDVQRLSIQKEEGMEGLVLGPRETLLSASPPLRQGRVASSFGTGLCGGGAFPLLIDIWASLLHNTTHPCRSLKLYR
jgi:hypothetical protein